MIIQYLFISQAAEELKDDDAQKLQNRKWVASAVVDSEKAYLECLNTLHKVHCIL
jgi:phage-related minor tail protein